MEKYDVIIVGGGASGLMCASKLTNKKVLVLEKDNKIGKKILVTGNGRCNLTNKNLSSQFYNTLMVDKYFKQFNNNNTLSYFESIGLNCYADECGRYYPLSNHSSSVLDVLRLNINKNNNIVIKTDEKVENILKSNNNFTVKTSKWEYVSKYLVFSAGGNFDNIFNFSVPFASFQPSLCSLITTKNKLLLGVRQKNVKVNLLKNNALVKSETGEILFKENAISGICVFNLSNYVSNNKEFSLSLDLLPNISLSNLQLMLKQKCNIFKFAENLLTGLFFKNLCLDLLYKCNIKANSLCKNLQDSQIFNLAKLIKDYPLPILEKDNTNNQIFSGGVNLTNLDDNLMLKNQANLFFTGEACDVSGICGGYNLQWAFTSASIVANHLNKAK